MKTNKFYTDVIYKDMRDKLKNVCPDIYLGNRPASVKESCKEFLVLSFPYSVRPKGFYQSSYYRVEIFVKTKSQGVSNIKRLNELSNQIMALFPMQSADKRYTAFRPFLTLTGDDGLGYSVWNLQTSLQINTTDLY